MRLWYAKKGKSTHTASVEAPDIIHNMIRHIYVIHYQKYKYKHPDKSTGMYIQDDGQYNVTEFSVKLSMDEIKRIYARWICDDYTKKFYPEIFEQGVKFLEEAMQYEGYQITYSNKF
ncbi:hypothetical protein SAMN02910455_00620 [Acidaminococcus fermentans]|uniref:hypothetical protein n=1 Tax=Acidaminococcus fermentans TaxID=905 RepID=UPI0008F182E4|nr:hypothetical protein [Acidaminococcus fermentans]SFO47629.1 hypothetical protein SAMN02910455_00620 [Acidaminococcus fermentans]